METLKSVLVFVIGIIVGVVLDLLQDKISNFLKGIIIKRSKSRYEISSIPEPSKEFRSFRLGNFEIPVAIVVGSPETPFFHQDVNIIFDPIFKESLPSYPIELKACRDYLINETVNKYNLKNFAFNDIMPRIDDIVQGPEKYGDKRGDLTIHFSLTTYGSLIATNRSLDYRVIPASGMLSQLTTNQSIREAYCRPPYTDLSQSYLANPPGVDVAVISRNLNQSPRDQLIIRQRSKNVLYYHGYYQVSATGYVSLAHCNETGIPDPFITAITEARQEIADGLILTPEDFKLVGLGIKWEDLHPGFYGYIETGISVAELLGDFSRDSYEGTLYAIPFEPKSVLTHIAKEKWHAVSALSAISALLAFYPRSEVEAIAKKLPAKTANDFIDKQEFFDV